DDMGVALAHTGNLQFGLILIGPEPGRKLAAGATARERRGRGLALLDCILNGFEPETRLAANETGAVASGQDPFIAGAAVIIDGNAVVDDESGLARQFLARDRADACDNEVDIELVTIGKARLSAPRAPRKP